MSTGLKANSDGSAALQVGGTDVITLTSGGAATFVTSPTTIQAGTAAAPSLTFSGDTNTGIYSPAADTVSISTGGTQRLTMDASGNLGIGTTSPSSKIHVDYGASSGFIRVDGANGGTNGFRAYSGAAVVDFSNVGGAAGFFVGGTERARIDSSGNLLVGTASGSGSRLDVYGDPSNALIRIQSTAASDSANRALNIIKYANDSTTAQVFVTFAINQGATGSGRINANGASAAAFGSFSDVRLKENIIDLPSQLENIKALRPVEFDYKDGSGHQIGFIAQEILEIFPDVVAAAEDEMLMVTGWSKTEARLVKAIQEQQAMIDELKAKVTALESA